MENFKVLKIFGIVFKVFAWVILVVGLIGAAGFFVKGGTSEVPKTISISILTQSLVLFLVFYAFGEVIKLLLVLEERTKKSANSSSV